MDIIIDKIDVFTWIQRSTLTPPNGEPRQVRAIRVHGRLSTNFFPFVVLTDQYPPEPPPEYPKLPSQYYYEDVTRPITAQFKANILVSDIKTYFFPYPYGKTGIPIDREGIHKIVLQGSWTPVLCIPATKPLQIEVNTFGRNDYYEEW